MKQGRSASVKLPPLMNLFDNMIVVHSMMSFAFASRSALCWSEGPGDLNNRLLKNIPKKISLAVGNKNV